MSLLIDGYNLLSTVGILGRNVGPGSLHRARLAMLNFLAESLDAEDVSRTTVVFDAADSPAGMPRKVGHRGLTVLFASQYDEADDLLEELIRSHSAPRRLTVVSSDHRLQRAARRRKARGVDSDIWYAEVVRRRQERVESAPKVSAKPPAPLLGEDVEYWIRQFGGHSLLSRLIEEESAGPTAVSGESAEGQPAVEETAPGKLTAEEAAEIGNPFPPGYAEDLLEDEQAGGSQSPFPPGYGEDLEED